MKKEWEMVQLEVSKKILPKYFIKFIQPLNLLKKENDHYILSAPNQTLKTHVEEKYQKFIEEAISNLNGQECSVAIELIDEIKNSTIADVYSEDIKSSQYFLNPDYKFDHFITGDSNMLAYFAAKEVILNPGKMNPLYIYGKVGIGKTHLLHSIGNEILSNNKKMKISYLDMLSFMSEFRFMVQNRDLLEGFKNKYKSVDVLLIDDIQYLNSTAEKTQEEFFSLFNHLYERKKQIILAADRPVHELSVHDVLKSRFTKGNQIKIGSPTLEIRSKIVEFYSNNMHLNLTKDIVDFISTNIHEDVRSLLGALNDIFLYKKTYSLLFVTLDKVAEIIQNRLFRKSHLEFNQNKLVDLVCNEFGLDSKDVMSKSRKKELVIPRHLTMYLLHELMNVNKSLIGRMFKTKHTAVIYAVANIKKELKSNLKIQSFIDKVKNDFLLN